ncbi:MAG: AsmA-like C-terminal region-containing protein [Bryobacteraceae bacterium]
MRSPDKVPKRADPTALRNRLLAVSWLNRALIGLALLALVVTIFVAVNWPFQKQAVIDALQESSAQSVSIDHFYRTYFPPGCVSEKIRFRHGTNKAEPPLITVQKLTSEGSYLRILTFQRHLSLVRVEGMRVTVPPKGPDGTPSPVMPVTRTKSKRSMEIGTVIADGTVLDFFPKEPGKQPFHLIVHKLALDDLGKNHPISYRATIFNPKPPGEIQSTGRFGPWNPDDPGRTAVTGSYTFRNANLAFFKAISGTLYSTGKFNGILDHIEVAGTTDTPNFQVFSTSHRRRLTTEFHASVDATGGDTFLENVIGHFDRTTIAATGSVTGENGKVTAVDLFGTAGRIEDLLDLFIKSKRPPMAGSVRFRAHVELPPQSESFMKKLKLVGDFGIGGGKFMNPNTQRDVGKLSESAQKAEKRDYPEDPATVLSNLKGHVVAGDGIATLSNLSFRVPGAYARIYGTYSLIDYKVDLHGTLITTGKIADATSGFKAVLVKAITPLFKKKASAKIVHFKITGKYQHTTVSLDLGAKK